MGHQQTQHPSLPKLHAIIVRIATSSVGCPKTSLAETMVIMRLALLLPLAHAADDHIKPAEFLTKWGTDTLPEDATISTPALAEAWMKRGLKARDAGALEAAVRAQWRGSRSKQHLVTLLKVLQLQI